MTEPWRQLRVGDLVRIVRRPQAGLPWSRLKRDTKRLYDRLIAEGAILPIEEIDEWGHPWISYRILNAAGVGECHTLAINDDSWELVSRTA